MFIATAQDYSVSSVRSGMFIALRKIKGLSSVRSGMLFVGLLSPVRENMPPRS